MVFWPDECAFRLYTDIKTLTDGREFFKKHYLGNTYSNIWGTALVRREVYNELMPFDERFGAWADVDIWMRICLGWEIAYLPEIVVELFEEEGQLRSWNWKKPINIQDMFFANICRHFDESSSRNASLKKQLWVKRKVWLKSNLRRILHREFKKIPEGYFRFP